MGRFIHIPPRCPRTDWANDFGRPWWKDDSYCIGLLSQKTRKIRIINTLTSQEQTLEVLKNAYICLFGFKYFYFLFESIDPRCTISYLSFNVAKVSK